MKLKVVITVFAALIIQLLNAQEEVATSRSNILGGSMSFTIQNNSYPFSVLHFLPGGVGVSSYNSNTTKYTTFNFAPYYAREINPRLTVGAQLSFGRMVSEENDVFIIGGPAVDRKITSNNLGIRLFTRHTLNPAHKLKFHIQPFVGFNTYKSKTENDNYIGSDINSRYLSIGIAAGMRYEITDRWAALIHLGDISYVNGRWDEEGTDQGNDYSALGSRFSLSSIGYGFEMRF